MKGAVDRTLVSDFDQLGSLRRIKRTDEGELAGDAIDPSLFGDARLTIRGVDLFVTQRDLDRVQRPAFTVRVHAQSHRSACPKSSKQQVVG